VMNDDLVQPERGFGKHPHRNAEICTYVVHGQLTHQDSMGTKESLGRGSIQFMTAGSGVTHSEHNLHKEPLRFIQMWFTPERSELKPNYGSMCGSKIERKDKWGHMVSHVESKAKTPVKVHCDMNMFASELSEKKELVLNLGDDRQAYFLCIEGTPTLESEGTKKKQAFNKHDAAELYGGDKFTVTGPGHVIIVEMKKEKNGGRSDI